MIEDKKMLIYMLYTINYALIRKMAYRCPGETVLITNTDKFRKRIKAHLENSPVIKNSPSSPNIANADMKTKIWKSFIERLIVLTRAM